VTEKNNGNWTYKVAANWTPLNWVRLRATYGTSFRSPALFEEFLADETGFLAQSQIDPCIRYGLKDNAELAANCASEGIPPDYIGAGGSALISSGGGIGHLKPETSKALTLSAIFTPDSWMWNGGQFSFAVDYIDIKVANEISQLGAANILAGCYTSDTFPNDGLCSLFTRNPEGTSPEFSVTNVSDLYLNINQQQSKALDFTTRFRQDLGRWGTLSLLGQMTYQLHDSTQLFSVPPSVVNSNGRAGDPKWVGNLNVSWNHAPFTLTYGLDLISATNNFRGLQQTGGTQLTLNNCLATAAAYALRGGPYCPVYKLPRVAFHSLSAEVQVNRDFSFLFGVSNLFDKKPPLISTVGTPIATFAQVPQLATYYQQGWFGRRFFISAKANLPNF